MKLHGVVTMDIVGSREIADREKLQEELLGYINEINAKYAKILCAPVSITLGDEWQLITSSPHECYNIVHDFQQMLWKDDVEFYAGIGIGNLDTAYYEDIRKMDGPCFHMSREAINIAKKGSKDKSSIITSKRCRVFFKPHNDILLNEDVFYLESNQKKSEMNEEVAVTSSQENIYMGPMKLASLVNMAIENNEILKSRMTRKQKMLYIDYIKAGTYRRIVEMNENRGETIGGISQKLNNAEFFTIQRNNNMIANLLYNYCLWGK